MPGDGAVLAPQGVLGFPIAAVRWLQEGRCFVSAAELEIFVGVKCKVLPVEEYPFTTGIHFSSTLLQTSGACRKIQSGFCPQAP